MNTCQETSGFLFSHTCSQPPQHRCGRCGKVTCQGHSHMAEGQVVCTTCAKAYQGNRRGQGWDDNPYFYAYYYYPGYGSYRRGYWGSDDDDFYDFGPADGESLSGGEGEGFEMDMGGS